MVRGRKSKILVTEALPLFLEERKILEKYANVKLAKNTTEDNLAEEVGDVDIIMVVYAKITEKIIDSAKKLKGIVRYGMGYDNIDIAAATERGIPVAYVPDYCVSSAADHAFAILLALNRRLLIADKIVRTGKYVDTWTTPSEKIKSRDLEGKLLGIIGLGKIGRLLVKRAKGFDMKLLAYDPYVKEDSARELGVELVDLDTLLRDSDFISIHAPLLPTTRRMIGERELKLMKKNAYLINVARGPLVDERALYTALKDGWIAGAGIDVYEKEPPDPENPLFKLENIVLTPHIAWYSEDALRRLEMSAVDEAIRILQGQQPRNVVNKTLV